MRVRIPCPLPIESNTMAIERKQPEIGGRVGTSVRIGNHYYPVLIPSPPLEVTFANKGYVPKQFGLPKKGEVIWWPITGFVEKAVSDHKEICLWIYGEKE